VWDYFRLLSGGLRYAATTGYYLTALQAEPGRYPRFCKILSVAKTKLTGFAF